MSDFEIGSEGGSFRKARELPDGTRVRVVSVEKHKSSFFREIRGGDKAGEQERVWQLQVKLELLEDLDATVVNKGRKWLENGDPADEGELFYQFYGGVYPRGDPEGEPEDTKIKISEGGGAYGFIERMMDAGIKAKGDLSAFAGIEGTIESETGKTGTNNWRIAYVAPDEGQEAAEKAPSKPAKARKKLAKGSKKGGKKNAAQEAFEALDEEDQEAITDALEDPEGLNPDDLVTAGIAEDTEQAELLVAGARAVVG